MNKIFFTCLVVIAVVYGGPCSLCEWNEGGKSFSTEFSLQSPKILLDSIVDVDFIDVAQPSPKFLADGSSIIFPFKRQGDNISYIGVSNIDGSGFRLLAGEKQKQHDLSLFKCYPNRQGTRVACSSISGGNDYSANAQRDAYVIDCPNGFMNCGSDVPLRKVSLPPTRKFSTSLKDPLDIDILPDHLRLQDREFRLSPDGEYMMWTRATTKQFMMLLGKLHCPEQTNLNCSISEDHTWVLNPVQYDEQKSNYTVHGTLYSTWYEAKAFHFDGKGMDYASSQSSSNDYNTHRASFYGDEWTSELIAGTLEWDETIITRPGGDFFGVGSSRYYSEPERKGNQVLQRFPKLAAWTAARLPAFIDAVRIRGANQFLENATLRFGMLDPWLTQRPDCNSDFLGLDLVRRDREDGWESISDYDWNEKGTQLLFCQRCVNNDTREPACKTNSTRIRIVDFTNLPEFPPITDYTTLVPTWAIKLSQYDPGFNDKNYYGVRKFFGTKSGYLTIDWNGSMLLGKTTVIYDNFSNYEDSAGQSFTGSQTIWINSLENSYSEDTSIKVTVDDKEYNYRVNVSFKKSANTGFVSFKPSNPIGELEKHCFEVNYDDPYENRLVYEVNRVEVDVAKALDQRLDEIL